MKNLLIRSLTLVLVALLTFVVVFFLSLSFGMKAVLADWQTRERNELLSFIKARLHEAAEQTILPDEKKIAGLLEGAPHNPAWIVVTATDGTLLYFYRQMNHDGQSRNFLRRLQDITEWHEIILNDGTTVFRYSAYIPPFMDQASNSHLVRASRLLLLWGSIISALLALVAAWLFSRPLSEQLSGLTAVLDRIAAGERTVQVPRYSLTELDHIYTVITKLQRNLEHEETLRRQWAADIAHDLRTPLMSLRGQIEGMRDGVFTADGYRLGRAIDELGRIDELVSSLSLLTRLETPGYQANIQCIESSELLKSIESRFAVRCQGDSFMIKADTQLLERALANLIINATSYGTQPPEVTVTCNLIGDAQSITITNSGEINEQDISHIFDRLYRAETSRSRPGNGLGLSIVKAVCDIHGWNISVGCDRQLHTTSFTIQLGQMLT